MHDTQILLKHRVAVVRSRRKEDHLSMILHEFASLFLTYKSPLCNFELLVLEIRADVGRPGLLIDNRLIEI